MQPAYYIGLDVHKEKISYCVKDGSGPVHREGSGHAMDLDRWMRTLPQPWGADGSDDLHRLGSTII